jgi:hypothetical protein
MASDSHASRPDPAGGLFDFKAMIDAMEHARRSWSAMPIPSAMTPTLDPDELDKRIADLKTVEQWLVLNLNLLRGSIQALQLQRDTLSSLHSFGAAARAAAEAASGPHAPTQPNPAAPGTSHPDPSPGPSEPASKPASSTTGSAGWAGGIDPSAWWNTLQSQFQQVAESAFAGISQAAAPEPKPARAPKASSTGRSRSPKRARAAAAAGTAPAPPRARRRAAP